ncbi:MAG: hypothetical protein IPO89_15830 [Actinomycetales bacterium]|nr:hypothetical protein [Candidatus Lutibacillus vidarii]
MGRHEEALRVAEELLTDVEQQRLKASEVVLKASRLARLVGHDDLTTFLGYERSGYPTDGSATAWIGRAGRWSESDEGKFYPAAIAKIEAKLAGAKESITALRGGGNYSGDYIAIAAREHDQLIGTQAMAAGVFSGICGQVVATVYDMVAEIYHELLFSELQASLFAETQMRVDGSLAEASGSALDKIEKVSERLRDGDPESISQALTTCRRLIDSCADHVFPPEAEAYEIGDGVTLSVGQQNVLNRMQAYTHRAGATKARRDRLRLTVRELYSRCSAGTHAQVTLDEARFIFLQTYVVLGEILTLTKPSPTSAAPRA